MSISTRGERHCLHVLVVMCFSGLIWAAMVFFGPLPATIVMVVLHSSLFGSREKSAHDGPDPFLPVGFSTLRLRRVRDIPNNRSDDGGKNCSGYLTVQEIEMFLVGWVDASAQALPAGEHHLGSLELGSDVGGHDVDGPVLVLLGEISATQSVLGGSRRVGRVPSALDKQHGAFDAVPLRRLDLAAAPRYWNEPGGLGYWICSTLFPSRSRKSLMLYQVVDARRIELAWTMTALWVVSLL